MIMGPLRERVTDEFRPVVEAQAPRFVAYLDQLKYVTNYIDQ
jgi:hypothetical protein